MSPAEAKIIVGGPHTGRGWVCKVIRMADTGSHTQQPLITVGDIMILEHFVK